MMTRKMTKQAAKKAFMAAAALTIMLAAACSSAGTDSPPTGETTTTTTAGPESPWPEISEWNLDRGPVSSSTEARLESGEIRELVTEYTAVTLWSETAMRTALNEPQEFEKVMFSTISTECVRQQQERMETVPDPPVDDLLQCNRDSMLSSQGRWEDITREERAARATRSVGLLFWALDPPSLISVMIAQRRGLDVSVRTNAEFARFAANYDVCEESLEEHAKTLEVQESSRKLAGSWTEVERNLRSCIGDINEKLFQPGEQNRDAD